MRTARPPSAMVNQPIAAISALSRTKERFLVLKLGLEPEAFCEEALADVLARTDVSELGSSCSRGSRRGYGVPISRVLRAQAAEPRQKRRFSRCSVKVIFPLSPDVSPGSLAIHRTP